MAEYLQIELLLRIKPHFFNVTHVRKVEIYILAIKNVVYDYMVDSVKEHATRFQCYWCNGYKLYPFWVCHYTALFPDYWAQRQL